MTVFAPATLWPPRVGDYARVRHDGILGEVVEISRVGADCRYSLNLFAPAVDEPLVVYWLDELEPIWGGRPGSDAGQAWDDAPPPTWGTSWPSWTR